MENLSMAQWSEQETNLLSGHEIISVYTSSFKSGTYIKHYICTDGFELWGG